MRVDAIEGGVRVLAFEGAVPLYLRSDRGRTEPAHVWFHDFDLPVERARGLGDGEDHLHAASVAARLMPGQTLTVAVSLEDEMLKVAANQMDYAAVTQLYSKSLQVIKIAIGKG